MEKEIAFYKEEREVNLEIIRGLKEENQEMRSEIKHRDQNEEEFSFGGYFNVETQTEDTGNADNVLNAECYEISIKSLLEENSRLKKTLILLDKSKKG